MGQPSRLEPSPHHRTGLPSVHRHHFKFQIHVSATETTISHKESAESLNLQTFRHQRFTLNFVLQISFAAQFLKGKGSCLIPAVIISASINNMNPSFTVICSKLLGLNNLHSYICYLIFNYQSVHYMKIELDKYRCSFLFKALWVTSLVKP